LVIDTLVEDIYKLLDKGSDDIPTEAIDELGKAIANTVVSRLSTEKREATLRMSNIGKPCERSLWYDINEPEKAEPLTPDTKFKFLFGDIIEEVLLFLSQAAGHKVEGRQSEQSINGIKGHRDAVIDGVLVDVKSASSYSFKKFKDGKLHQDDPFGYITQIQSYSKASEDDPAITDHRRVAFLVVDKTLGHICLDVHPVDKKLGEDLPNVYEGKKEMVAQTEPPKRAFAPEDDGKSGNKKLGIKCSYCAHKFNCYPNLRVFNSYKGPVYLTTVKRQPNMPEMTKNGTELSNPRVLFTDEGNE
jgi:hypothetical protein